MSPGFHNKANYDMMSNEDTHQSRFQDHFKCERNRSYSQFLGKTELIRFSQGTTEL